jgi:flagellin-like hook-associated protein FlgL
MQFRTTAQTSHDRAIRYVSSYNRNIAGLQKDISSGIHLHRASDDPVAFRQVTLLTGQLQQLRSESTAIDDAEAKLNTSVSSIQQAYDVIVRARTLAQQGVQATTESERNALAVEAEGLLSSLQDISKSKSAGAFLYSGARSDQPPYEFGEPLVEGATMVADYKGFDENSYAYIGTSIAVETFYAGDQIFSDPQRGDVLVHGTTGAKNGAGTDSMVGRANLIVNHTLTTYSGTSGVAAGASSAGNDTVLGAVGTNSLTIVDTSGTGASGTVTLNNGAEIPWNQADTNLEVVGEDGRGVFLDMSGITSGFNGSVDLASNGTVSVDGGATEQAIDFSSSQTLIDSTTGEQVHIDTSGITQSGTDYLEFPGTSNVFQVFHELISDLKNTRNLDSGDYSASLDRRIGELTGLGDNTLIALGRQSASLVSLDELGNRLSDLELETQTQINDAQATDIPDAVLHLQNQQSLLEFTYSITAQITSTSILDFLR